VELDRDAPRGALTAAEGYEWTFSGWLELAAAIEAWRQEAAKRSGEAG
jgi:hypothetical protein